MILLCQLGSRHQPMSRRHLTLTVKIKGINRFREAALRFKVADELVSKLLTTRSCTAKHLDIRTTCIEDEVKTGSSLFHTSVQPMLRFPNHKTFASPCSHLFLHENNMPKMLFYSKGNRGTDN